MNERSLRVRFAIGVGLAIASLFLMLGFAAVLAEATGRAGSRTDRRALLELAIAMVAGAVGVAVAWPAVQQLRQKLLETGTLVGAVLMTIPAAFAVWVVAVGTAHALFP